MSTTANRRYWRDAAADAEAFRAMFPPECYERWEFAGSLRRQRPEVGDVEHCVIPRVGEIPGPGLFSEPLAVNLLWHRMDALIAEGKLTKHVYQMTNGTTQNRYHGTTEDKYRGVDFRGFNHEVFTATVDNWGAIFLIRTGPWEYSRKMVTCFKQGGLYRQQEGKLVHLATGEPVKVPTEEDYFRLARVAYCPPERRRAT